MISPPSSPDPTEQGHWRDLLRVQRRMDRDLESVYAAHGLAGLSTRFSYSLIRLAHRGPMTIRELAESLGHTHSAISQTVTAMREQGLVHTLPGADARTRVVHLTDRARELLPFLEAEWRSTEQAIVDLEAEMPFRLAEYVDALNALLDQRGFAERVGELLEDNPPTAP